MLSAAFQRFGALCLWLAIASADAPAQPDVSATAIVAHQTLSRQLGTISLAVYPQLAEERLSGCSMEFSVLVQDWSAGARAFVKVAGSLGLIDVSGELRVFLNVVLDDVQPSGSALVLSSPASAYFVPSDPGAHVAKGVAHSMPDTRGGVYVIFRLDPAYETIATGLMEQRLTIAVHRPGSEDLQVPIDTLIAQPTSNGERGGSRTVAFEFFECAHQLMQVASR